MVEDRQGAWKSYRQEVLERIGDFSELFAGVRKQKAGSDGWVSGCCPLHDDKNPSFAFNRRTGQWCCFSGCGKGSAFDFLMQTTGSSFKDALLALGDKAGVPKPAMNGHKPGGLSEVYVEKAAKALEANERLRKYLREKRGLTDESVRKHKLGWDAKRGRLVIPVRDEKGNLVNVRFYSPSKQPKMMNLKGYGNTPRLYGADELAAYDGKQIILCEGELDRLILCQNGFMAVTSTHGCRSFRKEWLAFFKGKDLVVGYDADNEGQAAAQGVVLPALQGSEVASVKNLRLPLSGTKDDKDFSDLFTKPRSMNGNLLDRRCYTAQELQRLIDNTPPIDSRRSAAAQTLADGRKGPDLLQVVDAIRESDGLSSHQRYINIGEAIAAHFEDRGAFFYDPKASIEFLCLESQVYTVGHNRPFNALLQKLARMNITTAEGRFVWEFLRNHARQEGQPVKSAGWVLGDPLQPAVFIHTHNAKGEILKLTPGRVTLIANGQNDDKVMLNPSDRVQPFRYIENADAGRAWALYEKLLHKLFPCNLADQALLSSLVPLIFLKDFCPARPLIRLSGSSDSGKTTAGKLIGYAIYGEDIAKTGTIASFYTDASRNPLAMIDNLEVPNVKAELLDFLLTSATGIVHEKKKLYTDQDIVREKATSFIVTTGIESLGKPELLSRQWDVACDESFHNPAFSHNACMLEILANRDLILSAVFDLLAHKVLPQLARRQEVELLLKRQFKGHPKDRTFECLSLTLLIWDALEDVLGIERDLWIKWLKSQQSDAEETSVETNIILQFLNLFAGAIRALRSSAKDKAKDEFLEKFQLLPKAGEKGICFEASAGQLLQVFTALAKLHGYPRPFENAKQLMARVKEALAVVRATGWQVEFEVRKSHGDRIHRFQLPVEGEKQGALPGVVG